MLGFFFLQGVRDYSVPVGLDGKAQVDLVVVGSVAVSEKGEEKNFQQKGPKFQSSVRKVTLRGRDRFVLAAELCSWVLLVCVTNPCSQSQQWPQRCFVLQENSGGKQFFVFKGIQAGSMVWDLLCSHRLCERTCVRAADSGPIWGSDFAFSSILETCWCWKNFPLTLSLAQNNTVFICDPDSSLPTLTCVGHE